MNNDQLKNKIMGIISTVLLSKVMKEKYILKCGDIERIADALIAAGIGDVKEAERKSFVFKNELAFTIHRAREPLNLLRKPPQKPALKKMAEMKHRAEVAERALDLCETAYILALNNREHEGISQQAILSDLGVHGFFMQQAEKELSEEGNAG